jgi:hypothetical protein
MTIASKFVELCNTTKLSNSQCALRAVQGNRKRWYSAITDNLRFFYFDDGSYAGTRTADGKVTGSTRIDAWEVKL